MSRWMPNGEPTWNDLCAEITSLRARCEAAEAKIGVMTFERDEARAAYLRIAPKAARASALEAALRDAHKSLGAGGVLSLLRDGRCDDADQMIVATIEAMRAALEGEKP